MKKINGKFISFEGPEASGKSSQINLLKQYFIQKNIPYLITREPGGTRIGEQLRSIILNQKYNISILQEILLLMASRSHHIDKKILPALKAGKVVISDRFADSTFVYQGFVNGFGIKKTQHLHQIILDNFLPHKTFLFELSPKNIILRLKNRKVKNKYDKIEQGFHKKVLLGYKKISKNNNRFIIIDASQKKQDIHEHIKTKLGI